MFASKWAFFKEENMETFEKAAAAAPAATKRYVKTSFDIADRIHAILKAQGRSQKELAQLLGKRESEISKWMTGQHNLTIKTISAIETALDEDLLAVTSYPRKGHEYPISEANISGLIVADTTTEYGIHNQDSERKDDEEQ